MELLSEFNSVFPPSPVESDSSSGSGWSPLYGGGAHLDQEAIQYIHKFYCKDCRMEAEKAKAEAAAAGDGGSPTSGAPQGEIDKPVSPQATLEEVSLQQSMDKNRESLKRKLMMRRPVSQLVDQGIYPPLKTPPAFAEQRKHLERAKTGDILKQKISQRPDRKVLVQQHILEDTNIDPSLHERQRKLKKSRLADDLNDKLLHRPGPLDLIRDNILKTEDNSFNQAVKDGKIYPIQMEGSETSPRHFIFDDDSNISDGAASPGTSQGEESGMSDIGSPPVIPTAPEPPVIQVKVRPNQELSPLSKLTTVPAQSIAMATTSMGTNFGNTSIVSSSHKTSNSNNNNINRARQKKNKQKVPTKSKIIKFHEYKGPPSASKSQSSNTSMSVTPSNIVSNNIIPTNPSTQSINTNTNSIPAQYSNDTLYHIRLQQQQLILQWQLENMNKQVPPVILPAQKTEPMQVTSSLSSAPIVSMATPPPVITSPTTITSTTKTAIPAQTILSSACSLPSQTFAPKVVNGPSSSSSGPLTTVIKQALPTGPIQTVAQPHVQQVKIQTVQQAAAIQKPGTQIRQIQIAQPHIHQIHHVSKPSAVNRSPQMNQKPITSLEDMKVADLKAELKKRNLPVSGPKPQLIERLKPYADSILSSLNNNVNVDTMAKVPVQVVKVKSLPILSHDETSLTQPSPPSSPKAESIQNPLSPETMDIASPGSLALNAQLAKSPLSISQPSIPMAVDNSRPSSVVPDIAMEVDNAVEAALSLTPTNVQTMTQQTVQLPMPGVSQIIPQSQTGFSVAMQPVSVVPTTVLSSLPAQIKTSQAQNNTLPMPVELSSDILRQQQLKIAELQKQLEESQMRLKMQQMQHQQLQHQQNQLQQLQQAAQQAQILQKGLAQQQQHQQQQSQQPIQIKQEQPTSPPQLQPMAKQIAVSSPQPMISPISPPQKQPLSPPQLQQISSVSQPLSPSQLLQQSVPSPPTVTTQIVTSKDGTKILHIPAQSLASVIGNPPVLTTAKAIQLSQQGIQSFVVTSAHNDFKFDNKVKVNGSEMPKGQTLLQSLNVASQAQNVTFKQPVVMTTSRSGKTITLTAPLNGISSRTSSLPSSPVDGKLPIIRSASNPYFIPNKEPPKYDEAVRNKHLKQSSSGMPKSEVNNGTSEPAKVDIKSQAMDDVLEILIRSGELPPSAAETPQTPKAVTQVPSIPVFSSGPITLPSMSSSGTISVPSSSIVLSTSPCSAVINQVNDMSTNVVMTTVPSSIMSVDVSYLLNSNLDDMKRELSSPDPVISVPNPDSLDTNSQDFLDISEMLGQDLNTMDWTSDQAFSLDLTDTTPMSATTDLKIDGTPRDLLDVPGSSKMNSNGSDPDISGLDLHDPDNDNQMDVSDWLDTIMPQSNTGLTPLTSHAPVSFPSDPILTPKTQEVLDLFNFEDSEFSAPTEMQCGLNWDKIAEATGSTS